MDRMTKIFSRLILGMLLIPGILTFALPQKDYSENENRLLTQRPALSAANIRDGSYQDELTDYLSDQFPLRDRWMMTATQLKLLTGRRDISDTYIGKDHYYFEKILESDIDLNTYTKNLARVDSLAEDFPEITSFLLLVPSAGNVLSDKLPDYAEMYDSDALYTMAEEQLTCITPVNPTLQLCSASAASSDPVYYRTDHHWTAWGAYTGYQVLAKETATAAAADHSTNTDHSTGTENTETDADSLIIGKYNTYHTETVSDNFLGTLYSRTLDASAVCDSIDLPIVSDDIAVTIDGEPGQFYDLSCLSEKDQYQVYLGGNHGIVEITNCNGKGTLLIIKDSFANCLVPYLTEDYETIIMIDLRYYPGSVRQYLQEHSVDHLLVIYELSNFAGDTTLAKLAL